MSNYKAAMVLVGVLIGMGALLLAVALLDVWF